MAFPFSCKICGKTHCHQHRMPENHQCPRVMAARHIEKSWLKKDMIDVTNGRFAVVCHECRYESNPDDILLADEDRSRHIKSSGHPAEKVWLKIT